MVGVVSVFVNETVETRVY